MLNPVRLGNIEYGVLSVNQYILAIRVSIWVEIVLEEKCMALLFKL